MKKCLCNSVPDFLKCVKQQSAKFHLNKFHHHDDGEIFWIKTPDLHFGINADQLVDYVFKLNGSSSIEEMQNTINALIRSAVVPCKANQKKLKVKKLTKTQLQKLN